MTALCSLEGCTRDARKRGMCDTCYKRLRNRGEIERLLPARSVADRLAAKLVRKPNGCLEWTGCVMPSGHGQIRADGKVVLTHRLAWELVNGPIPDGLRVRHFVCDNPPCCDVTHLRLGTAADNSADMAVKGRAFNGQSSKTHCPQGHPYDEANTLIQRGGRMCRECRRASWRRWKAAAKIRTTEQGTTQP